MINRWLITGDCHGDFSRFRNYSEEIQNDSNTAVIILGDAGLNFFLDERDAHIKNLLSKKYAFSIYCVRGNHPPKCKRKNRVFEKKFGSQKSAASGKLGGMFRGESPIRKPTHPGPTGPKHGENIP